MTSFLSFRIHCSVRSGASDVFRYGIQCRYVDCTRVPAESGETSSISDYLVSMEGFSLPMLFYVGVALKEPAATAENRVIANVTQVVSQVIDTVQSVVAIPAGKGRNHFAGEWVCHVCNGRVIDPFEISIVAESESEILRRGTGWFMARWSGHSRPKHSAHHLEKTVEHRRVDPFRHGWGRSGCDLSKGVGRSGCSLSQAIGLNYFPLPLAYIEKHRLIP